MTQQQLQTLIKKSVDLSKEDYQYLLSKSPHLFIQLCFAAVRPTDYYVLQDFHLNWIDLIHSNEEVEITAPRGFAKSTIILYYLLHHTLFHPSPTQPSSLVVADSPMKAREFAEKTILRALQAPKLIEILGQLIHTYTSRDIAIDVEPPRWPWMKTPQAHPSEPTIRLRGNSQEAPAGIHIQNGLLVFDDAAVSQTAKSALRQEKRRDRIEDYRALATGALKTIHSDTRYTKIDYGIEVLEPAEWCQNNWDSRSAYTDKDMTKYLWPEKAEEVELARKTMSPVAFRLQFQNDVSALEGAVFSTEIIESAYHPAPEECHAYVVGADMAYGGRDFTAAVRVGIQNDIIYLIDYMADRYEDINEKYTAVVKFAGKHPIITEANGPQKEVPQLLQKYGAKQVFPYIPRMEKLEKIRENLSLPLASGKLYICHPTILREFKNFSGDSAHDDLLDAAFMGWWYAENYYRGSRYAIGSPRIPRRRKQPNIPRRRGH